MNKKRAVLRPAALNAAAFLAAAFLAAAFLAAACQNSGDISIQREDLAQFNIGRLEDELDLFDLEGERSTRGTELAMRDGQFYISNGNGQKIVRYNSYGDLLLMIYNSDTNPPPLTLKEKTEEFAETRWAVPFALNEPGKIAVDENKNIFVVDKIPDERHSYDREERAILDRMILHFDEDGRFAGYLGQEGPGGTPFPIIDDLSLTKDNRLVAVCKYAKSRIIFTYDAAGNHLSKIKFSADKLPEPPGKSNLVSSLDGIAISPDDFIIYLKIDYYHEIFDDVLNTVAGMEPDSSYIWLVNLENGEYLGAVELPFFELEQQPDASGRGAEGNAAPENLFYSLFGAMRDGKVFLYSPVRDGFSILIIKTDAVRRTAGGAGEVKQSSFKQRRGSIKVSPRELRFFTFNVSENGLLSALLADEYKVKLVWWRTDRLAEEM